MKKLDFVFFILCMLIVAPLLIVGQNALDHISSLDMSFRGSVVTIMYLFLVAMLARIMLILIFSFCEFYRRGVQKQPTHYPLVSLILPCFNEANVINASITSVLEVNYPNVEILVVDDGSGDETLINAKKTIVGNNKVRVIYQMNAGKAAALNRAISEAKGEYVLCMDADSKINKDVLHKGIRHFETDKKLAAVAGSVIIGNPKVNFLTWMQSLEYTIGLNFYKASQSFFSAVTIVPGPVGLFRKDVIQSVGGYKENCFAEDCDLTVRILTAGYRVTYEPEMISETEAPIDFNSIVKQRYRWTRGILQAFKLNAKWLVRPFDDVRNFFIMWYMLIESILVPTVNFIFSMLIIYLGLTSVNMDILGYFFIQLTLLDAMLTMFSTMFSPYRFQYILLSVINRITYGLMLDTLRFFSLVDELLKIPMTWGKLKRTGLG